MKKKPCPIGKKCRIWIFVETLTPPLFGLRVGRWWGTTKQIHLRGWAVSATHRKQPKMVLRTIGVVRWHNRNSAMIEGNE